MTSSFAISDILSSDDSYELILSKSSISIETETSKSLLRNLLSVLSDVDRFQHDEFLENWILEISVTDDEGIELMIRNQNLDIICFLLEDDDEYSEEEILDLIGLDDIYIANYHEFLADEDNSKQLLQELRLWEVDSNFHVYAIDHLDAVLSKGYDLAPFGGQNKSIEVEFSFDEEEIFVGCIDEEYETLSANPDYNLAHHQFDPNNIEDSLELGIQSWSEVSEEDDSWDDTIDDEDWSDDEDLESDDWDSDADEE